MLMTKLATMTVWNVEHGLAVHIKAPNDKYIVVDLGCSSTFSPLKTLWRKQVDYMIITHTDLDHIQDIGNISYAKPRVLNIVKCYSRTELLNGVQSWAKPIINAYCDLNDTYTSPISHLESPHNPDTLDGLEVKTFRAKHCDKSNRNNQSAIVVLKLGGAKVVICGDNEQASFDELMENTNFRNAVQSACVLVASHHGRKSGYHKEFVELVDPYLTIISDTSKVTTSASQSYKNKSKGYPVNSPQGVEETRYCLTTRKDGNIKVVFGESDDPKYIGTLSITKGV